MNHPDGPHSSIRWASADEQPPEGLPARVPPDRVPLESKPRMPSPGPTHNQFQSATDPARLHARSSTGPRIDPPESTTFMGQPHGIRYVV